MMDPPEVLLVIALCFAAFTSIGLILYSWWKIRKTERLSHKNNEEGESSRERGLGGTDHSQE